MKKVDDEKRRWRRRRILRIKFVLAASFCLPLLYLVAVPMLWWLTIPYPGILEPMQYPLSNALAQIALTLPIIIVGYRFFLSGLKALFQRSPNMDTLIATGALASVALSLYSTYQIYIGNFGASDKLYFAPAGAIITISLLGKLREASAKCKVYKKVKRLTGKDSNITAWESKPSQIRPVHWLDTVSGYYVPILGAIAVIAAGAWLYGGQSSSFTLTVFLTVFIIACPSSLGLAVPNAIALSTRKGAKQGILIKGTEAFETAAQIDTVVLATPELICKDTPGDAVVLPAPTIKESSQKAIQTLHSMGIEVMLMTGGDLQEAEAAAQQAGISRIFAGIQPQDSVNAVNELKSEGKKVAVIGSGASDAPVLLKTDAGIVIGLTSDKAIAASDIVLMRSDLADVAAAIKLCRRTMRVIRGNLFWAFGYHVAGVAVAAGLLHLTGGPLMNPVLAMAALFLGALSVFVNTLRLKSTCR